jgi:F-type H+-transporting ATPase subunit epsilon
VNVFNLHLFAANRYELIDQVVSFTAEDSSGRFGLQARHERFMTTLTFGLASLLRSESRREYLGLPGGVIYFVDNELRISTRRYVRGSDAASIAATVASEMLTEERELDETRRKLHRLEAEMVRHLSRLDREPA